MLERYGALLLVVVIAQAVTYSYFLTTPVFTNHTFPNSWVQPFPSPKTWGEGRWLADFLIGLQGGSGVQPLQMVLAIAIQAVNGVLLARLAGLARRLDILLVALTLSLFPAFLDYYSFAEDHFTFVVGDLLALWGVLHWKRSPHGLSAALGSGVLFVLALAAYQPKVALVALLCLVCLAVRILDGFDRGRVPIVRSIAREVAWLAGIFSGACLAYFLSTRLLVTLDFGVRTHLNTFAEVRQAVWAAFGEFVRYHSWRADYLPQAMRFLPAVGIAVGAAVLLRSGWREHPAAFVLAVGVVALVPVAVRLAYVVNARSWGDAPRLFSANGYALVFTFCVMLRAEKLRTLGRAGLGVLLYFLVVVGTQESNAAVFKTLYDTAFLNRLAGRLEEVAGDLGQHPYGLVVVGDTPRFRRERYVRYANQSNQANVQTTTFEEYRQTELLNFFLGGEYLVRPTREQERQVLASVAGRDPWPAKDSVYVANGVLVVLLERYSEGVSVTTPADP